MATDGHPAAGAWIGLAYVVLGIGLLAEQLGWFSVSWPVLLAVSCVVVGVALLASAAYPHRRAAGTRSP